MQYCSLQHQTLLSSPVTSTIGHCFALAPSLHSFWNYFSTDLQQHIGHLPTWGVHLSVSCLFAFSCYSWGPQGNNTEVVCHSLLQWTTFCQNSSPQPIWFGWPYLAWLIVSLSQTRLWSMRSVWLVFCDCSFYTVFPLIDKDKRFMEEVQEYLLRK